MKTLGVDPGASGGLALIDSQSSGTIAVVMPDSLQGLVAFVRQHAPDLAIVESVHAFPGQGVTSCFTFGKAYGSVLGVLAALSVPVVTVGPKAWHKAVLGIPEMPSSWSKADRRKEWKRLACAHAALRWPTVSLLASPRCKVAHDGIADALCIASYAQHMIE